MPRRRSLLTVIALCIPLALPVFAQGGSFAEPPSKALIEDATTYSDLYGVPLEEAIRRLLLQSEAGRLSAALAEEEAEDFAGLWIEHKPDFLVVVRFRNPEAVRSRLEDRVKISPLAGRVELRPAGRSLAQLEALLEGTRGSLRQVRVPVDLMVDIRQNRVSVRTINPAGLRNALAAARLALPAGLEIEPVDELIQPETTVVGGTAATTCSWGFTVRHSNGEVGIATAAHCSNTQSYAGVNLPFRSEDQQGNQDVQWHSACDIFDVTNEFQSGIGLRSCTGTRSRSLQVVGELVCKNGMSTGRTCGEIASLSYAPSWVTSAASTFIYVDGDRLGVNLSEGGDSGSPWFVEQLAYGIHSGGGGNDSVYMPINYISSLGVSVLTSNPGSGCRICGDGVCETGESCLADCSSGFCGDGNCDPGEFGNCFPDCGSPCPPCFICPCGL